ncbi:hypothetical protein B0H12DRAFT_1149333 [Mycena haematopus]|nr:hypothetical protein B0H12DRAFT_1149333 [Mycena haematopus]
MSRLMMVKATNKLVGKRELSGQQTASHLLGRKNRYTSDEYQEYWWSSLLRDIARDIFAMESGPRSDVHDEDDSLDDGAQRLTIPDDEDDSLITLLPGTLESVENELSPTEKKYSRLFEDYFFRPTELENTCLSILNRAIPSRFLTA